MNTQLKKRAMAKAKAEGWTLTAVLNQAAKAYVEGRIGLAQIDAGIAQGLDDIQNGRVYTHEDILRDLEAKKKKESK